MNRNLNQINTYSCSSGFVLPPTSALLPSSQMFLFLLCLPAWVNPFLYTPRYGLQQWIVTTHACRALIGYLLQLKSLTILLLYCISWQAYQLGAFVSIPISYWRKLKLREMKKIHPRSYNQWVKNLWSQPLWANPLLLHALKCSGWATASQFAENTIKSMK